MNTARSRPSRRYRSGIRSLEDRVTMSASAWSQLDLAETAALLAGTNYVQNELVVALEESSPTFADLLSMESAQNAALAGVVTGIAQLSEASAGNPALYQLTLAADADFTETLSAISNWTTVEWVTPNFLGGGAESAESTIPPGSLDPTFDGDGMVRLVSPFASDDAIRDMARQSDGKLVVIVGPSILEANHMLMRFNADGSLDTTFGLDGRVQIPLTRDQSRLSSVELTSDGKILVAGFENTSIIVLKFTSNGAYDASFGGGGVAKLTPSGANFTQLSLPTAMTLQSDGKIVIAQYYQNTSNSVADSLVARFNADGTVDNSFDLNGYRNFAVATGSLGHDAPYDVAVQTDGKIVVSGFVQGNFYAARFTTSGAFDNTFGSSGIMVVNLGGSDEAYKVAVQSDGKIVLAGRSGGDLAVVRLNTTGTLDSTFGTAGIVITNVAGVDQISALGLQSDGKIVAAGFVTTSASNTDFAVFRYTTGGVLDTTFDGDGIKTIPIGPANDAVNALVIQPDGAIIVGGYSANPSGGGALALARILPTGAVDSTFGVAGIVTETVRTASSTATAAVAIPGGGTLVAGIIASDVTGDFGRWAVWRLTADGALDTSFGSGGYAIGPATTIIKVRDIARQSDGSILLLTSATLIRLTADGQLDAVFGVGGTLNLGTQIGLANALEIQANGSILIAGIKGSTLIVLRLLAGGTFDSSFSGDGIVDLDVGPGADQAFALAIQADGKILAAGQTAGTDTDMVIVRLNVDGSLDTAFSNDGKIVESLGTTLDVAHGLLVQADGRIVVGGNVGNDLALVRYLSDGSLDASFGTGGKLILSNQNDIEGFGTLLQQSDGKYLVVGNHWHPSQMAGRIFVARFNSDGTRDSSFDGAPDGDGMVEFHAGRIDGPHLPAAVFDADGKLIVVGRAPHQTGRFDAVAYRLLTVETGAGAAPSITAVADQTIDEDSAFEFEFTVSDADTPPGWLRISVDSSAPSLFTAENGVLTDLGGGTWRYQAEMRPNQFGTAVVTISVFDGWNVSREQATITVRPINDAPTFTPGGNVAGAAGATTVVRNWATGMSAGFPNEFAQSLTFEATATDPGLFDVGPTIGSDGTLSFAGKSSAVGLSTVVTVRLRDDGGAALGGVDVSTPRTFTITIGHAPQISAVVDRTIAEGSVADVDFSVADFDTPMGSIGVSVSAGDPSLASLSLVDLGSGNWRITALPAADRFGTTSVSVTATDGVHTTIRQFTLTVTNVNDVPSFVKGLDQFAGAGPQSVAGWATSISAGALEGSQNLSFLVIVDDPSLFAVQPTISADGTLSYAAAAGKSGVAQVTVRLQDDGGIAGGGVNQSAAQTFAIRILAKGPTAGDLDPTFQGDGAGASSSLRSSAAIRDLAVQADGKIVAVGAVIPGMTGAGFVIRYLADGSLDTTFGAGGVVRIDHGPAAEAARQVRIAADGKIYVAFDDGVDFNVARLNADGTFDATFGQNGFAVADSSSADLTNGMALQADGKIVVVGLASHDLAAVRFNADGTLDNGFGVNGFFRYSVAGPSSAALNDVVIQNDGRIVAIGTGGPVGSPTGDDLVLIRLTTDGRLDSSFDGDGILMTAAPGQRSQTDFGYRLGLDGQDRIIAAGRYSSLGFFVARFDSVGAADHTFGGDGWVTVGFPTLDSALGLVVRPDGRIVVGGFARPGEEFDFGVVQLLADGDFDLSFNGTGRQYVSFGEASDTPYALAVDAEGRVLLAGQATSLNDGDAPAAIVRLSLDGRLDRTFSADGRQTTGVGPFSQLFNSVVRLADGSYLVSGAEYRERSGIIAKYRADGSLDTSFGTGGVVYVGNVGFFSEFAILTIGLEMAVGADGKIAAIAKNTSNDDVVMRLNADGSPDTSFSGDGFADPPTNMIVTAVTVQADGKILVAGSLNSNLAVARYNVDGSLDTSFSFDGVQSVDAGAGGSDGATAIAIQADGKIVVSGYGFNGVNTDFVVARFTTIGSIDFTFDGDGWARTAVGTSNDVGRELVIQTDGKIVVGGIASSTGSATGDDWALVRYNSNGSLDTSFDGDGKLVFASGIGNDLFGGLRLQADGKLVAVGSAVRQAGGTTDTIVARFLADGRIDPTFAEDGVLLTPHGTWADSANDVIVDPDGKIVVVGYAEVNGRYEGRILRLLNEADEPPTVAGVFVRGSTWSQSYLDHLDATGHGDFELAGLGFGLADEAAQTSVTLSWNNVNRITVRFDRDVIVESADALVLTNSAGQTIASTSFRYVDGRTVEWTVPTLTTSKYLIHINSTKVADIIGRALDGEWTTSDTIWAQGSGNGTAGGSFNFRFNVLQGDFDSSGAVSFGEIGQARLQLGKTTAAGDFNYRQDYDGSGSITFGEIGQARAMLGTDLSSLSEPPVPPEEEASEMVGNALRGVPSDEQESAPDAIFAAESLGDSPSASESYVASSIFVEPAEVVAYDSVVGFSAAAFSTAVPSAPSDLSAGIAVEVSSPQPDLARTPLTIDLPYSQFGRLFSVAPEVGHAGSRFRHIPRRSTNRDAEESETTIEVGPPLNIRSSDGRTDMASVPAIKPWRRLAGRSGGRLSDSTAPSADPWSGKPSDVTIDH